MMRWLQWSTIDLEKGMGGVEVHARAMRRELRALGVDAELSSDREQLLNLRWDVIHMHGSAFVRHGHPAAVKVHTLHGSTLGRMLACGELTWPAGYAAASRETLGVACSDVILSVRPRLSLFALAGQLGKSRAVCWNGWDAGSGADSPTAFLSSELEKRLEGMGDFWLFVGRGEDRMKGADRVKSTLKLLPDLKLVAAPGRGFEDVSEVIQTGVLTSDQVRSLLKRSAGMFLPSRYEGNSLAILEALAEGVPVVTTGVGAARALPSGLKGFFIADSPSPQSLADNLRRAGSESRSEEARSERARLNRSLLPSWRDVALCALRTVEEFRSRSGRRA